ncbi:MAG: hypothetical protein ACRD4R_02280 [Candidatus Acidiferrales bacterium]
MSARANALRLQVETALAGRVASPFEYRDRRVVETVPAGVPEIDRLTGGLPRGGLTEICGPPASGRTSVLVAAMAARTEAAEVCALVDARDAFDPQSAAEAGVRLGQLLWVRCRNVDQALRATDLLIQGGGFGLIALDLGDTPARVARAIPLPVWFRMRRAVENTPTILVALELESNAKTCASLVLRLEAREARWAQTSKERCDEGFCGSESGGSRRIWMPHTEGCLFEGARNYAEMARSRAKREGDRIRWREETSDDAEFETEAIWNAQ